MKKHPFLTGFLLAFILILIFSFIPHFLEERGLFPPGEKIAVVEIKGIITNSEPVIDKILKFKKNKSVKAIVLRINSPGGAVGPSQEIYEEIKKINQKKKVVASMDSIATSGGYYVACAAEKILANPGTITGSIGVLMKFTNIEELLRKIGLKGVILKSGEYKDVGSPLRKMTLKEEKILKGLIDDVHLQFIEAVAKGRKIPEDQVKEKLADGRIFSGKQAKDLGLVDELGNIQDAIQIAAEIADIKGEPRVIYPEKKTSLLEILIKNSLRIIKEETYENLATINYLYLP